MNPLTAVHCLVAGLVWLAALTPAVHAQSASQPSEPIPVSQLGAKAGAQYQGDGLSVAPTPEGARLRCVFQKLEGQVTREGLWLVSTVEPQTGEKFRVVARAVGREGALTSLAAARHRDRDRQAGPLRAPRLDRGILRERGWRPAGLCGDAATCRGRRVARGTGRDGGQGRGAGERRAAGARRFRAQDCLQPAAGGGCRRQRTDGAVGSDDGNAAGRAGGGCGGRLPRAH